MQVDLPEPLGPITATKSPRSMTKSMPPSACIFACPLPYTLLTFLSSIKICCSLCMLFFATDGIDDQCQTTLNLTTSNFSIYPVTGTRT